MKLCGIFKKWGLNKDIAEEIVDSVQKIIEEGSSKENN